MNPKFAQVMPRTALVARFGEEIRNKVFHTNHLNWSRIFNGDIVRVWDQRFDPNIYGVIHCQLAGDTVDAIRHIRKKIKGGTVLVVNPDYSIDYWNHYGHQIETMFDVLDQADVIFGQCEATVDFLTDQMPHREIHYCPHPVDTRWLNNHAKVYASRSKDDVIINVHRDEMRLTPHWILRGAKLTRPLVTHMVGWNGPTEDLSHKIYDHAHGWMVQTNLIDKLWRNAFCIIDHYQHHVQGRAAMEAAALGVPYLAWDSCDVARKCYPELTAKQGDYRTHIRALERLCNDEDFCAEISANAKLSADFYSFDACEKRFKEMIEWDR